MKVLLGVLAVMAMPLRADFQFQFDETERRWTLANEVLAVSFQLTPAGVFKFEQLKSTTGGIEWKSAASSVSTPIRFQVNGEWWDEKTTYRLLAERSQSVPRGGYRQSITLGEVAGRGQVVVTIELYANLPVVRYGIQFRNTSEETVRVTGVDLLPWELDGGSQTLRTLHIEQWMPVVDPADFERLITNLDPAGVPATVESGAHGRHCAWLAILDSQNRGLAAGWEFDGRATIAASQFASDKRLHLEGIMNGVNHPVKPGDTFQVPFAFLGAFQGDWDNAAYVTQRFTEAALAKAVPGTTDFPYVSWDSWGYGENLGEDVLKRNAEIASRMGVELFVVDLGWARRIGDWREDPAKFPGGLRAISEYVHSLGMKFGLHLAWAESDSAAPVLLQNPDWTSSESYGYYGAESFCLSHVPARDWLIQEIVRIVDDYGVDWILQDGENMVKECTKTTHTHDPADSNYSNAVDGLDYVLQKVQALRPNVAWENCENGGNLMTFQMVQNYVTSIVNDASGALGSRQSVYGASYPFPPRYTDRYMPEEKMDAYTTRSYMFGGPWILMNRLTEMTPLDLSFLGKEMVRFKSMRQPIRDGKVLHLTNPPAAGRIDVLASYLPETDSAIAIATRDGGTANSTLVQIRALTDGKSYRVTFADDTRTLTLTGLQIRKDGVPVALGPSKYSEIVYIQPLR